MLETIGYTIGFTVLIGVLLAANVFAVYYKKPKIDVLVDEDDI